MTIRFQKGDTINGQSQIARAIWALGALGQPASPSEVADYICAETDDHWAGAGAGRFFLQHFEHHKGLSPYFLRSPVSTPNGGGKRARYVYQLTDRGQRVFEEAWKGEDEPEDKVEDFDTVEPITPFSF